MHLLKQKSKPVATGKKRRKYEIIGTLDDFKEAVASKRNSDAN